MDEKVNPLPIFEAVTAYQRSFTFKTAVELAIFSLIAEGRTSAGEIASGCSADARAVRMLCDTLTAHGFLIKSGEHYSLSEMSAVFLDRKSPAYLGGIAEFMVAPRMVESYSRLTEAVRKGGTALEDDGNVSYENPIWVRFARAMMPMMMPAAQAIPGMLGLDRGRKLKVLDIAAGHGIFGILVAQAYPNAAIVAQDWSNVLEVAVENAERFGVSDRYETLAGSAFDVEFGSDYDVVLLTNFLHHFDRETCEALLQKVAASMNDDGVVATLEFVPNEDRVTPPEAAAFSVVMLASTPKGDAYTMSDLRQMFENAGFGRNELRDFGPSPEKVIISRK